MRIVIFQDLKTIDYKKAWDYQENIFNKVLASRTTATSNRSNTDKTDAGYLLFCEHPHVFTLGKSGAGENLLINPDFLQKIGATYYKINRGGDITYHGPGQLVGYPILNLEALGLQVKQYIYLLEETIIRTLSEYGINSTRMDNSTGVWLDAGDSRKSRKICAIGVRASRYVTMHGFAFNINTDLSYFGYINPCGMADKGVTSLQKEMGEKQDVVEVSEKIKHHFSDLFSVNLKNS